jgi:hypothetical protein
VQQPALSIVHGTAQVANAAQRIVANHQLAIVIAAGLVEHRHHFVYRMHQLAGRFYDDDLIVGAHHGVGILAQAWGNGLDRVLGGGRRQQEQGGEYGQNHAVLS